MSIPTTLAPVKPQDFTLTPLKVHKKFTVTNEDIQTTGSGFHLVEGLYSGLVTPVGAPQAANDPINSVDGTYKHIMWRHINQLYYNASNNPYVTLEHHNSRYTFKYLNYSASLLSIPYMNYGESIKPGSVQIINSTLGYSIKDDGNGNLYDESLEESLLHISRNNTVAYWGFNEQFRNFKYKYGTIESGYYPYKSYTFNAESYPSVINNVMFSEGLEISSSVCGMAAEFDSQYGLPQFLQTPTNNDFNFDRTEEFTISFWLYAPTSGDLEQRSVLSKKGVEFINHYGAQSKITESGTITEAVYVSSSYTDSPTNVYPYDIYHSGSSIYFSRSDGSRSVELSAEISSSTWQHIAITRHQGATEWEITLLVDGVSQDTAIDGTRSVINKKCVMLGASQLQVADQFTGKIDELRLLNTAITSGSSLDSNYYENVAIKDHAFNTAIIGNVFYRRGNLVISPLNAKYKNLFSGDFKLDYKGTHRIYQYEILTRIKKGDFNLTMNPTALKSPKSDLLIDEMTGSLLSPYFTTIGYYNDAGDLLAVGKMGQPIQVRSDVDINILARMDA